MKILTVRQPWACSIFHAHPVAGLKNDENRVWPTDERGLIAIHSSARHDKQQPTTQWDLATSVYNTAPPELTEYSAVLGVVRIADCHPYRPGCCDSPWGEQGLEVWHWVLADVQAFAKPIPNVRGALRLWTPGDDLLNEIRRAMEAGR